MELENEILNYTEHLFAAALAKSGNLSDAEDLAQEVLLAALAYGARGGRIANMRSWLLTTLDHKWNDMLRQKYKLPMVSIDMIADERVWEEAVPEGPNAEQIRREVAYLAKLQREVIVRHYLQGQKVQRIAQELGVPKGTVLSRLSSGREQMRKGLEKMEQYEKQSYIPERLDIGCSGNPGPRGLGAPGSCDLMRQNILIMAYEKPLTMVEIARALGVPTPYVENAVEELVESELMFRNGNKVFTDFMIVSPEQNLKKLEEEIALAETHYDTIWACVEKLFEDLRGLEWHERLGCREREILRYYAMLDVFSRGIYTVTKRIIGEAHEEYPSRPDGGAWIASGNRYPADFDFENYRIKKYCYGGERRVCWEDCLGMKSIDFHVYDTQPDLNRYEHGPVEIHDDNLCKLLVLIHHGTPIREVGFNPMFLEDIPHLVQCGVLTVEGEHPRLAIPVLGKEQYEELWNIILASMYQLADVLEEPLRKAFPEMKIGIPRHLEGRVSAMRQYDCHYLPMAVVKKAVAQGDFLKDVDYPTPPMVLMIEQAVLYR